MSEYRRLKDLTRKERRELNRIVRKQRKEAMAGGKNAGNNADQVQVSGL